VDWKKKKFRFPHKGKRIQLLGIFDDTSRCTQLHVRKLKGLLRRKAISHCVELSAIPIQDSFVFSTSVSTDSALCTSGIPDNIQHLIKQYSHLFQELLALPPMRPCDDHIPLIPGAQPVNVRPYRYNPLQKTEIEKQTWDMLK